MLNKILTYKMFVQFLWDKITSNDTVERNFSHLIVCMCVHSALYTLYLGRWLWSTTLSGAVLCCIYGIYRCDHNIMYTKCAELLRLLVCLCLMLVSLVYFMDNNKMQHSRINTGTELWDNALLQWDTALLGHFWPRGQLALWLDHQNEYNPGTTFGHWTTEILQLFYVSYYFVGNVLCAVLLYKYGYHKYYGPKAECRRWYRIMLMYLSAWIGGFLLNYTVNLCVPAVSPRVWISTQYTHQLRGVWIADWFQNSISKAAVGTYGAFPSAHCSLSVIAPILTHRLGLRVYTWIAVICAVGVIIGTVVLRYHYMVDVLAGLMVCILSVWWSGWLTQKSYDQCTEADVDLPHKINV